MSQRLPDPKEVGRLFAIGQVGIEMVVPIGVGVALDFWWGTLPWGTVVGAVLGFTLGLVHLVRLSSQQNRDNTKKKPEQRPS
jgi:F0F1-type ATP synthase assembly protein I